MAKRAARRPGKSSPKKPSGGAARGGPSKGNAAKGKAGKGKPSKGRPTKAKGGATSVRKKRVKGGRATVTETGVYARPGQVGRLPSARPSNDPADKPKRRSSGSKTTVNLPPREDGERLQKLMAAAGVASRRECEEFILEGRVQVDGKVVTELGVRIDPVKQQIFVDGEALPKTRRLYFAVNKPDGVVCTARDPAGRPRITDLLPPDVGRVFNVGRLDMASEGLILLTNDGELANQLTHPKHGVEKVYHVQVQGHPTSEILASLRKGVYLAEGKAHFVHAKVKSKRKSGTILEVVLDEGRNREIRRVLARVGHKVQRLTRIAVGPVRLADLPQGAYRPLTPEEVKALRKAVADGRKPKQEQEPKTAPKRSRGPKSGATGRVSASTRRPARKTPSERNARSESSSNTESRKPRRTILGDVEPQADKPRGNQGRNKKTTSRSASKGKSTTRGKSGGGKSKGAKASGARASGNSSTGGRASGGKAAAKGGSNGGKPKTTKRRGR